MAEAGLSWESGLSIFSHTHLHKPYGHDIYFTKTHTIIRGWEGGGGGKEIQNFEKMRCVDRWSAVNQGSIVHLYGSVAHLYGRVAHLYGRVAHLYGKCSTPLW